MANPVQKDNTAWDHEKNISYNIIICSIYNIHTMILISEYKYIIIISIVRCQNNSIKQSHQKISRTYHDVVYQKIHQTNHINSGLIPDQLNYDSISTKIYPISYA
jgi:hypothetical protein